ncbi:MAG: substrate-binding domain-containing protein [Pirellulales bacterium]|nr:substrate-binding domain-containing protein [Pirellulales bacterium]
MLSGLQLRREFLIALGLLAAILPCAGCGEKTPNNNQAGGATTKRIVLLNNTESTFWDAARAGIKDAVTDLKLADANFTAEMDNNDGTGQGQVDRLKKYYTRNDIVAVGISPIDAGNASLAEELEKLKKKGVVIICFDSDLPKDKQHLRDFYIGTNNVKGGQVLGTAAKNLQPKNNTYVQFVGVDTQQNAVERMDGFKAAMGDGFQELERKLDNSDRKIARDNVRQVLTKHPDVGVLVGIWSYNAPAIADEVGGPDRKQTVATFDAEANAITHMQKGNIDVMVVQNPFMMGYLTVKAAYAKLNKDDATIKEIFPNLGAEGGNIKDTGLKVVIPEKGSPLTADTFKELNTPISQVELLTLPDFQAWLKKYGLTDS